MGKRITVTLGDGIGPEIMNATLRILKEVVDLEYDIVEVGEKVYLSGNTSGITKEAWESIFKNKVFLKAPITTPQGGGYKSVNVTVRKALGLFANVRPVRSYDPFIPSKYPGLDMVIVRENEEDLYGGIEYQQSPNQVEAIKFFSFGETERIIRFAFEYARAYGRKKVTCMAKDNIMKMTDGLFHKIFDAVSKEYPDIKTDFWIIDIGTAKVVDTPSEFDVVVMPNLYGDIASDIVAQIAGSVGLAPGANIGDEYSMFEAIHGSAPRRAGQNLANPSGLLLSAVMMLVHIEEEEAAETIHNAWLKTIEDGIGTYDIARKAKEAGREVKEVGTKEFADEVIKRLGKKPQYLKPAQYKKTERKKIDFKTITSSSSIDGVDITIVASGIKPYELGKKLEEIAKPEFSLVALSNRGQLVYPLEVEFKSSLSDTWTARFLFKTENKKQKIHSLLQRLEEKGFEWVRVQILQSFNGIKGYSVPQGM